MKLWMKGKKKHVWEPAFMVLIPNSRGTHGIKTPGLWINLCVSQMHEGPYVHHCLGVRKSSSSSQMSRHRSIPPPFFAFGEGGCCPLTWEQVAMERRREGSVMCPWKTVLSGLSDDVPPPRLRPQLGTVAEPGNLPAPDSSDISAPAQTYSTPHRDVPPPHRSSLAAPAPHHLRAHRKTARVP